MKFEVCSEHIYQHAVEPVSLLSIIRKSVEFYFVHNPNTHKTTTHPSMKKKINKKNYCNCFGL